MKIEEKVVRKEVSAGERALRKGDALLHQSQDTTARVTRKVSPGCVPGPGSVGAKTRGGRWPRGGRPGGERGKMRDGWRVVMCRLQNWSYMTHNSYKHYKALSDEKWHFKNSKNDTKHHFFHNLFQKLRENH